MRAAARHLRARVPGLFASVDAAMPRRRAPWGGPMNGQLGRQEIVRKLLAVRPPTVVIETGTHLGVSTEFFALLTGGPVWTVESQKPYFRSAKKRFRENQHVHLSMSSSLSFLRDLTSAAEVPKTGAFFYLDAHWDADLPLREEVEIITGVWKDAWILIDDFQVPEDNDYGYDDYGGGNVLSLDYLSVPEPWVPLFPRLKGSDETGARRGCALLVPASDLDLVLSTGLLRRETD